MVAVAELAAIRRPEKKVEIYPMHLDTKVEIDTYNVVEPHEVQSIASLLAQADLLEVFLIYQHLPQGHWLMITNDSQSSNIFMWDPSPDTPDTHSYSAHPAIARKLSTSRLVSLIRASPMQPTHMTCGLAIVTTFLRILLNPLHILLPIHDQEDAQTTASIIMVMTAIQDLPASNILSRLDFLQQNAPKRPKLAGRPYTLSRAPRQTYSPFHRMHENFTFPPCPPTLCNIIRTMAAIPPSATNVLSGMHIRHTTLSYATRIAMAFQDAIAPYATCYAYSCQGADDIKDDIYRMLTLSTTEMILILTYREAAAITLTVEGKPAYVHTNNGRLIPLEDADVPRLEALIHVVGSQKR
jgi:hypothetical protein